LELSGDLFDAAQDQDEEAIQEALTHYVGRATNTEPQALQDHTLVEVVEVFRTLQERNATRVVFPFLESETGDTTPHWHFKGRSRIHLIHLLASTYGWELETIRQMEPEEALAFVQEVLVDAQLNHEWEYGLSEVAYQYNKATKKSHFRPLPRPPWMLSRKPKVTRVLKEALPVGNVVEIGGQIG